MTAPSKSEFRWSSERGLDLDDCECISDGPWWMDVAAGWSIASLVLDGTLRAVVAADRLALSEAGEEGELVLRRLTVFYGYFALVGALGTLAGRARRLLVDAEPSVIALVLNVQLAHALLLGATFVALRFFVRNPTLLRALDVLATVATSATGGLVLSVMPRALSVDVTALAFFISFFALKAALVPGRPWLTTLVAAVSAVPFAAGFFELYEHAGVPDPAEATAAVIRAMSGGIAGVYVVSKTIYGLRRVVEQAVRLGQYVVHEKIGEGGMGTVYRASHAMLKRPTAIKLIAPERAGERATARFEREVLAASRLTHPNTVAIYDFGRTRGGVFYYAMELLDGENLAELVEREGPQPVARVLRILGQLSAALEEAHREGLVHRDVKPENVMLCTRGGVEDFVKVLDFGLVKDFRASSAELTADTALAGTPLYLAPEGILAPDTVCPATDVYALGCVAYFLLTGQPPFAGHGLVEVCAAHVHAVPEPPSHRALRPLPGELDALVLECLDKQAARRPTAHALGQRLAALERA